MTDVNKALHYFNDQLTNIFNKHAPLKEKKLKGKPCKWLNGDVKKGMDNRDKLLRKVRKSGLESDWNEYRKMRNMCNSKVKAAKKTYHQNLLNEIV